MSRPHSASSSAQPVTSQVLKSKRRQGHVDLGMHGHPEAAPPPSWTSPSPPKSHSKQHSSPAHKRLSAPLMSTATTNNIHHNDPHRTTSTMLRGTTAAVSQAAPSSTLARHSHSGNPSSSTRHIIPRKDPPALYLGHSNGNKPKTPKKEKRSSLTVIGSSSNSGRTSFESYITGPPITPPLSPSLSPSGGNGSRPSSPPGPLYNYIRPTKDSYLNLSPSAAPKHPGAGGRSSSLDLPRRVSPMGGAAAPSRPSFTMDAQSSSLSQSPHVAAPPVPIRSPKRRSNFLDISFHEGMSAEDVQMPGPEALTPPSEAHVVGFFPSSASLSGTLRSRGHRHPQHHYPHQSNGAMVAPDHIMVVGSEDGTPEKQNEAGTNKKKKKQNGWKRLSAGLKNFVAGR